MCILLNGTNVDELSSVVHVTKAQTVGRKMVLKLRDIIPRQMVHIAIQAVVNGKILARENIKAFRKDVTAKLVSKQTLVSQTLCNITIIDYIAVYYYTF